jgi:hypothetical protein
MAVSVLMRVLGGNISRTLGLNFDRTVLASSGWQPADTSVANPGIITGMWREQRVMKGYSRRD